MSKTGSWLLPLAWFAASLGCSSSSNTSDAAPPAGDASSAGDGSAAAATWTAVYTTVIAQRCMPCHTTAAGLGIASGHLDMTSKATAYQNLVNVAAAGTACAGMGTRITPGMPDSSVLYLKVSLDDPSPCGAKMPLTGAPLAQSDADMIESWIKGGALNN